MDIKTLSISDLSLDPANARKHSDRNIEAIAGSLRRFGQIKPIVVDASGVVRAGNGTLEAARQLGWTTIQAIVSTLSGAEMTAYAIADNRTAELAEWDDDVLRATLEAIQFEDEELLAACGYTDEELAAINDAMAEPAEVTEDEVPEPPADPITKPGDLWILGRHRLLCGDSTKAEDVARLMDGAKAEMMWADPPFRNDYKSRGDKGECERSESWDAILAATVDHAKTVGSWYVKLPWRDALQSVGMLLPKHLIVWAKRGFGLGAGDFRPQHEFLLYGRTGGAECFAGKDVGDVWEAAVPFRGRMLHVAETPVVLIAKAIEFSSRQGGLVFDPFLGSSTTIIAAEQLGRRCYGCEISPAYVDVGVARWEKLTGEKATCQSATLD